jgi:hypothetical protein
VASQGQRLGVVVTQTVRLTSRYFQCGCIRGNAAATVDGEG